MAEDKIFIDETTLATEYVMPETCVFARNKSGFLSVVIGGEEYKRVTLSRALPLSEPSKYISIFDMDNKEIGIIESVEAFSPEQRVLINAELSDRYYCPVITEITSIKEKMGHFYFDVLIGDFKKGFAIKDLTKSIRQVDSAVDLTDIDGNRYRINDFDAINKKSRRRLEPYLY